MVVLLLNQHHSSPPVGRSRPHRAPCSCPEHFRRWQHYMRYSVVHGYSYVHWCRDEDMLADPLTKVANKHKYLKFTKVFFNIRD